MILPLSPSETPPTGLRSPISTSGSFLSPAEEQLEQPLHVPRPSPRQAASPRRTSSQAASATTAIAAHVCQFTSIATSVN